MRRSMQLSAVGAALCLAVAALGLTGSASGASTGRTHPTRLTAAQARALHGQIRAGTAGRLAAARAAGTPAVTAVGFCHQHRLRCEAQVLAAPGQSGPVSSFTPIGLGARELAAAYGVARAGSATGTIAIIDAGAYPTIDSDLGVYRRQYGLPPCHQATGCLRVRNFNGGPQRTPVTTELGKEVEEEVGVETALDLDMASAACPRCRLLLLQLPDIDAIAPSVAAVHHAQDRFATAVRTARSLGAKAVSISYGYPTDAYAGGGSPARRMNLRGIAVTASTGDYGYNGLLPPWPQVLRSVIAVGGTELSQSSSGAWHEAVWDSGGSGCSAGYTAKAYGQPAWIGNLCNGHRAGADVAAVADPFTGVSVYDTYAPSSGFPFAWIVVGGTSASAPLVAGLYARAGVPAAVHGPNMLYAQPAADFHDVVAGANAPRGVCSADGVSERICGADDGWDGPTGRGTPKGLVTFR